MENEFIIIIIFAFIFVGVMAAFIFSYVILKKWFNRKERIEKIIQWILSGIKSGILIILFGIYLILWGLGIFGGDESRYEYVGETETHFLYRDKGYEPKKLRFVHFVTGGACIIYGGYRIFQIYSGKKRKKNKKSGRE